MTKTALEQKIVIDHDVSDSKIITGYIGIKSSETITLDRIDGMIIFEARGRMRSYKKELLTLQIANTKTLSANQTHQIPFTFDSSSFESDSYNGKNVTFSYKIETQITINSNDVEKLDRSIFSKVKSFVTNDFTHTIKDSEYFNISNLGNTYIIEEAKTDFIIEPNFFVVILALATVVGAYLYFIRDFNLLYLLLATVSFGLIVYLSTNFIAKTLGAISMQTLKNKAGFVCKISKTRRFNLIAPYIHYEIAEKVVDKRGTSTSIYTETLYVSEKKKVPDFYSDPNLIFSFPERKGLQSASCRDAAIVWTMHIKGKYMGLKVNYKAVFKVLANTKEYYK